LFRVGGMGQSIGNGGRGEEENRGELEGGRKKEESGRRRKKKANNKIHSLQATIKFQRPETLPNKLNDDLQIPENAPHQFLNAPHQLNTPYQFVDGNPFHSAYVVYYYLIHLLFVRSC
jgi:hypothetical protein